jgi:hypothetical protein
MKIQVRLYPFFLFLILLCNAASSQRLNDTLKNNLKGTLAISADTAKARTDTVAAVIHPLVKSYSSVLNGLLATNKYINVKDPPVYFITGKKKMHGKEFVFYTLCVIVLILGLFKTFYTAYFNNLFRVFFNTSIRQTQLTDQLLQARLPSLFLNIFFAITTGYYIWILFRNYHPPRFINSQLLLPVCILGIGVLYFVKYCILKFMGWMSGMQQAAENYIFVIFLVNKIIGIILIPFIIFIALSTPSSVNYITIFSLLILGLFFLSRYIKTYGVLEYKFPLQPLHFVIYILALEVIPLFIIYKVAIDYLV